LKLAPRLLSGRESAEPRPSWSLLVPHEVQDRLGRQTDAEGVVVLPGLPQQASVQLVILDDDAFAQLGFDNAVRTGNEPLTRANPIRLKPGASVAGRVVYGDTGKPVSGAVVIVQGTNLGAVRTTGWGTATSDAAGAYRITRLTPGTYNVFVDLPDALENQWAVAAVEKVDVREGTEVKGQDFKLVRGGVLAGKLIAGDTKLGLPGLSIGLYGPSRPRSSSAVQTTRTGLDGSFSFRVPPGKQHVYFQDIVPDGYLRPPIEGKDPEVREGGRIEVTLELPRDPNPPVAGRVLAPDGRPAAGAWVVAEGPRGPGFEEARSTRASESGRFRFAAVAPGTRIRARHNGMETTEAIEVKGGEADLTLQLRDNPQASLRVVVKDEEGKPVPGAKVQLIVLSAATGLTFTDPRWVTDAGGEYVFQKLSTDRRYSLWVEADGFGVGQAKVKPLKPGEKSVADPIVLVRSNHLIKGRVVTKAGDPVPGVQVEINGSSTGHQTTKTDDQGRFRFKVARGAQPVIFMRNEDGESVGARMAKESNEDVELVYDPAAVLK
jgi:uncharacterized GH25 family protein